MPFRNRLHPHRTKPLNSGFSLIEIVMVLAVIAILAMLALPGRFGAITQERLVETIELIEPYKPVIENFYRTNGGKFPENNAAAGLPEPDQIIGNYLEKVVVRDGALHLYLGQKLPEQLHHKILTIQPVFVEDSLQSPISWICGYAQVPLGMQRAGTNLTDIEPIVLPGRCRKTA